MSTGREEKQEPSTAHRMMRDQHCRRCGEKQGVPEAFPRIVRYVRAWSAGLSAGLLLATACHAQEMAVPLEQQIPLLLKTISFDRNLRSRSGERIVLGILYQQRVRSSLEVKDKILEMLENEATQTIDGMPIQCVAIDLGSTDDLSSTIRNKHINLLYVAPVRAHDMATFASTARLLQIPTLTGVPEYVEDGLAVGIGARGEKPCIVINLNAARSEGADFDSHLLNLAKVIE